MATEEHMAVMGIPTGVALAVGRRELRGRRLLASLLGAVIGCLATLALATPLAPPASRSPLAYHSPPSLPIALTPIASASIPASERSFWPVHRGASLVTHSGGIDSTFTASGARVRVAQGTVALSLAGLGHGQRLDPVAAVRPTGAANQVLYRHGSITELYRNGPYGVEQAFTVSQRPKAGPGPLVLALRLGGSFVAEQAGSQVVFRTHAGGRALRYGQLSALDATGRRLPAHMQLRNRTLDLQINDSNAHYPVRIDPMIDREILSGAEGYYFGWDVALSADADTVLAGAPYEHSGAGAAWVFNRSSATWTELKGSELTVNSHFGESVGLSSDGTIALVGGVNTKAVLSGDGHTALIRGSAVWVFTRTGTTWTPGPKLTPAEYFATFTHSGSTWTEHPPPKPEGGGEGSFGWSVALSSDGSTALVGDPGFEGQHAPGAAWVFTQNAGTWSQEAKLTQETYHGGEFGWSVALSDNGNTAVVSGTLEGTAHIFTRSEATWRQQAQFERVGVNDVALSGDGNTVLTGDGRVTPWHEENEGSAWMFRRTGSSWSQEPGPPIATGWNFQPTMFEYPIFEPFVFYGPFGSHFFGDSVALSSDGNTALIGARGDYGGIGGAWVFVPGGSLPTNTSAPTISGIPEVGKSLSCSSGAWGGDPAPYFYYGWLRDGTLQTEPSNSVHVINPLDQGHTLVCQVFAHNVFGEQRALSAGVAIPAPPRTTGVTIYPSGGSLGSTVHRRASSRSSTTTGAGGSVSSAQIAAVLASQLVPSGKQAKISVLLKRGGFTFAFHAPQAGVATIGWYMLPKGVKLAKRPKPVLVASGRTTFSAAGTAHMKIRLTIAGKRLLHRAKHLRLTAKGLFIPPGKPPVSATRSFLLKR